MIIGMCLCPPWNIYSRQRETPWGENKGDLSWGPYNAWDYWISETEAVTGATPVYEFLTGANLRRSENRERNIRRQTHPDQDGSYKFIEVEKKWVIDYGRLIAQMGIIAVVAAGLYYMFRPKKYRLKMVGPNESTWGPWGI